MLGVPDSQNGDHTHLACLHVCCSPNLTSPYLALALESSKFITQLTLIVNIKVWPIRQIVLVWAEQQTLQSLLPSIKLVIQTQTRKIDRGCTGRNIPRPDLPFKADLKQMLRNCFTFWLSDLDSQTWSTVAHTSSSHPTPMASSNLFIVKCSRHSVEVQST